MSETSEIATEMAVRGQVEPHVVDVVPIPVQHSGGKVVKRSMRTVTNVPQKVGRKAAAIVSKQTGVEVGAGTTFVQGGVYADQVVPGEEVSARCATADSSVE